MFLSVAFVLLGLVCFTLSLPMDEPFEGHFTFYEDGGYGACGSPIDANSENLVAISHEYFTEENPNNDPVCNYCVKVEYKGKSITLPIKDECPSCDSDHFDLSAAAFRELEDPDVGDVYGATFTFVRC